jgi:PAS domain S-box-containing protein
MTPFQQLVKLMHDNQEISAALLTITIPILLRLIGPKRLKQLWRMILRPFRIVGAIERLDGQLTGPNGGSNIFDKITHIDDAVAALVEQHRGITSFQRALASTVNNAMFTAGGKGDFNWVNEAWCDMTGLTNEQSKGFGWMTAVVEEDRVGVQDEIDSAYMYARDMDITCRFKHAETGEQFRMKIKAHPTVNFDTMRILHWVGVGYVLPIGAT